MKVFVANTPECQGEAQVYTEFIEVNPWHSHGTYSFCTVSVIGSSSRSKQTKACLPVGREVFVLCNHQHVIVRNTLSRLFCGKVIWYRMYLFLAAGHSLIVA